MKQTIPQNTGRLTGVFILLHLLAGLTIPYILLQPMIGAPAGFLSTGVTLTMEVKISVALLFLGAAMPVAVTIKGWPLWRQHGHTLSLWLIVIAVVNLVLQAVENGHWLSMLFMSEQYVQKGTANTDILQAMGSALRSEWKWIHYMHLLFSVCWMLLLYIALYRCALAPRLLIGFGIIATLMQLIGITLPALFSFTAPIPGNIAGIPLGVAYLALSVWLMIKGFRVPQNNPSPE